MRLNDINRIEQLFTDPRDFHVELDDKPPAITDKFWRLREDQLTVLDREFKQIYEASTIETTESFCVSLVSVLKSVIERGKVDGKYSRTYIISIHKNPTLVILPLKGCYLDEKFKERKTPEIIFEAPFIAGLIKSRCDMPVECIVTALDTLLTRFIEYTPCLYGVKLRRVKKWTQAKYMERMHKAKVIRKIKGGFL